MSHCS